MPVMNINTAFTRFSTLNVTDKLSASEDIVTIAVLSILVTAPLGAFLIKFLAPKLLSEKSQENTVNNNSDESCPLGSNQ